MNEIEVYLDLEFDKIHSTSGYVQGVIAFGACCRYLGEIKTFYSLVCPKGFKKLSKQVKEITHLDNEEIKKAPNFQSVSLMFFNWLDSLKQEYILYSFGPDDRRTLLEDCKRNQVMDDIYDDIENIQGVLSDSIIYKEKKLEDNLSLESLKKCYRIEGVTMHHALQDAIDLMLLHEAYKQKKPIDQDYVESLMKEREEHLKKRALQTKENEIRAMKQRFASYFSFYREIFMSSSLLALFAKWMKLEKMENCSEDGIILHDEKMLYSKLIIEMCVDINMYEPLVHVRFHKYGYDDVVYTFVLNDMNADYVEELLKNA